MQFYVGMIKNVQEFKEAALTFVAFDDPADTVFYNARRLTLKPPRPLRYHKPNYRPLSGECFEIV